MCVFIIFSMVLVMGNAKPEIEYEMYNELMTTAEQVLDSMEYTKEHANMQRSDEEENDESQNIDEENIHWDLYDHLDDEGVTPEYFQSFMLAEMADILLEAPFKDEGEPELGRFMCGNCFKKFKLCKNVCFGLVSVSAEHTIDFIPCATTCLQRISSCCVAQRNSRSKTAGNKGVASGTQGGILGQFQASLMAAGLGGTGGKGQMLGTSLGGDKGEAGFSNTKGTGFSNPKGTDFGNTKGTDFGNIKGTGFGNTKGMVFGSGMNFGQASIFGTNFGQTSGTPDKPLTFPDKIQAFLSGFTNDKDKLSTSTTEGSTTETTPSTTTETKTTTETTTVYVESVTSKSVDIYSKPTTASEHTISANPYY